MGTLVRIKLYAVDENQARGAFRAAFDRIAGLDEALSDYKPDSELSRLSRAPAGRPTRASEDLFLVLIASQELATKTDGAFDVTLGPVTRLWRQARNEGRPPDPEAIREASSRCGYRMLRLDAAERLVTLEQAGMQLDLGGIAKGHAADAALEALRERGIRSALVAVSGDIVCGDPPPGKRGWRIAASPLAERGAAYESILMLRNTAVSTSGDAEQHLDGDKRHSHIVDPVSSQGITRRIGVTVVAANGMLADGLATAVNVLGPQRGRELVEQQRGAAALIAVREGGRIRVVESSRFDDFVE